MKITAAFPAYDAPLALVGGALRYERRADLRRSGADPLAVVPDGTEYTPGARCSSIR